MHAKLNNRILAWGVSRSVDNGYIGVNGVARQFYGNRLMLYNNGVYYNGFGIINKGSYTGLKYTENGTSISSKRNTYTYGGTYFLGTNSYIDTTKYSILHVKFRWDGYVDADGSYSNYRYNIFSPNARIKGDDGIWYYGIATIHDRCPTIELNKTYSVDLEIKGTSSSSTLLIGNGIMFEWFLDLDKGGYACDNGEFTFYEIWFE